MTEKEENLVTLELMWRELLPQFDIPHERFLRSWLNRASVEMIIEAMEETVRAAHKLQSSEHAGAFTANRLNVRVDKAAGVRLTPDNVRALHFPETA
jgi:hypothetical protein